MLLATQARPVNYELTYRHDRRSCIRTVNMNRFSRILEVQDAEGNIHTFQPKERVSQVDHESQAEVRKKWQCSS